MKGRNTEMLENNNTLKTEIAENTIKITAAILPIEHKTKIKPLDKVKEQTEKKRQKEHER